MIQRHLEPMILESLAGFPAVLVTGARQVGKSTLVQSICKRKWKAVYLTLDDRNLLDAALTDPDGFIAAHPGPVAIDEVQRAPDLLRAIKLQVDRHRKPGRFLLTGSANVLTLRKVSETLAGRIALHELFPFSASEVLRENRPPAVLERLFEKGKSRADVGSGRSNPRSRAAFLKGVLRGGYPTPALSRKPSLSIRWFEAYRTTYIERDIRELQAIERLPDFGRLMGLSASRTGQLLNFSDLGRDAGLPYVTLRRYMNILEQTYQVALILPYFSNASKRMTKAPKLYWTDTGMACHLLDIHSAANVEQHPKCGALVETWVANELHKLISFSPEPMRLYGWRLQTGQEIDFLVEKGNRFIGIEVTWGRHVTSTARGAFRMLESQLADRLVCGIILYGGQEIIPLSPKLVAVPLWLFFRGE